MDNLVAKGRQLSDYLLFILDEINAGSKEKMSN